MTERVTPEATARNPQADLNKKPGKLNANVFVLGDLIIDHTAFVSGMLTNYPLPVTGEMAFRVRRRLDTAGGAATTARTINVLSDGTTFLWGLVGSSPWGTFRSILENSQALDGAARRIEFRGAHDETDAPMTTVSRLVEVYDTESGRERYERKARFVDYGQIHVPMERQVAAIKYHLDRVHIAKSPLDAIVLNDLDMGALHHEVIREVAGFSRQFHIPIIIRARRDASKYYEVRARALVCTLAEWKLLIGSREELEYWSKNMTKPEVAEEFARRTLAVFRNVDQCVVLVGDDWIDSIIVVERSGGAGDAGRLVIRNGLPQAEKGRSQQVGASDVFTGALTVGLCGNEGARASFTAALNGAIRVLHAYQRAIWHHIPKWEGLPDVPFKNAQTEVTSRHFGTPFLPLDRSIDMLRARTCVPGIYSITPEMIDMLQAMLTDVREDNKSLVLVASGGSGKTEVAKHMLLAAQENGFDACWFGDLKLDWDWGNPEKTIQRIAGACARRSQKRSFVVVDEVLKNKGAKHLPTKGVVLLNMAQEAGVRFLLIDADFAKIKFDRIRSQFARRVAWYQLPSAWERPADIPYVLASCLHACINGRDVKFSIEASALVAIIEWMLEGRHNFGNLFQLAQSIVANQKQAGTIVVNWKDLQPKIRGKYRPHQDGGEQMYVPKFV